MEKKVDGGILVRGVNWIGDAVMTMPALRSLRLATSDSKLTLLVKPWVSPLFEQDPNVDEIILYSDEYKGVSGRVKLAGRLRERGFAAAVLFQNALDAALVAFLAGIPERIGYSRDGRRPLLTSAVPFKDEVRNLHHVDYYLTLLERSGFAVKKSPCWIYLSLEERLAARNTLKDLRRPVVAINPGAAYGSSKRWHPERFADVGKMIIGELKGSVVLLGGPKESRISREIEQGIRGEGSEKEDGTLLNVSGKTGLRQVCSLISECDLLVTNDSGPMHIGYAVGTPVIAIFGSTSPELTGPPSDGNIVIRKALDCSPCFERECKGRGLKCMELITPDEVCGAVIKLLKPKRAVFFDRDGTLCRDAHYLRRTEDFEIFPGVDGLRRLKEKGFLLIGVSNQSGIARGIVDEDFVMRINDIFMERHGFDGFYYCPHHPDEHCSCRKPEPGLLYRARDEFSVNLRESFVVGDKESDMLLARSVGARAIHLRMAGEDVLQADYSADDLGETVSIIEGLAAAETRA